MIIIEEQQNKIKNAAQLYAVLAGLTKNEAAKKGYEELAQNEYDVDDNDNDKNPSEQLDEDTLVEKLLAEDLLPLKDLVDVYELLKPKTTPNKTVEEIAANISPEKDDCPPELHELQEGYESINTHLRVVQLVRL